MLDRELVKAVDLLVANGVKRSAALEIVGLNKQQCKTFRRIKEREKFKKKNKRYDDCKPWRCPTCGALIKIVTCIECNQNKRIQNESSTQNSEGTFFTGKVDRGRRHYKILSK